MSDGSSRCHCIICVDHGDRDRLGNFDLRTIVHVKQYGWSVVLVPADGDRPGWACTIGLWHSHRTPELAVFGLDLYEMEEYLNGLGRSSAAGRPPRADVVDDAVMKDRPVTFRAVDLHWYRAFFDGAVGFYRRPPLPYLQLIWPDEHGVFPWQPAVDPRVAAAQPRLWLHPAEHPGGVWTREAARPRTGRATGG